MPRIIFVATVLLSMTLHATASWAVYYSDRETPEAFQPYGLLVLDARYHPPLAPLQAAGKSLYGYVSLGEIELHHPLYTRVRAEGLLLGENPNWKGSYFVDLRDRRWHNHVLRELVPQVLEQGFEGLFLDTLDDAGYLEDNQPDRLGMRPGMRQGAIDLVRAIRAGYPNAPLLLNRAYDLLDSLAPLLAGHLSESCYAQYDAATKRYRLVNDAAAAALLQKALAVKGKYPALRLLSLDYWDPADELGVARIYAAQRTLGFDPYVATVALDRLVAEPHARRLP
jgi:uncharacterized protein (TIGR01370 family)